MDTETLIMAIFHIVEHSDDPERDIQALADMVEESSTTQEEE